MMSATSLGACRRAVVKASPRFYGDLMKRLWPAFRCWRQIGMISVCVIAAAASCHSQTPVTNDPPFYGPFNAVFFAGGDGLKKPLEKADSILRADSPWSMYAWVRSGETPAGPSLISGMGDPSEEFSRFLALDSQQAILWMGKDNSLSGAVSLAPGKWHFLAATFDGADFRLY